MNSIILQGGGEHARVVLDCLLSNGATVLALFDPKYKGDLFGIEQRGSYDASFQPSARAIVAIGDNRLRKEVALMTRHGFASCVHSSAIVSPRASIGAGCMLLHGSIIQARAQIGDHVIVNTGAKVDHDCVIGNYAHIAPGATLCGTVVIGEGTLVGAGATILPGTSIGRWCTIGAGAVVTTNVADNAKVVGNPAREITIQ